MVNLDMVGRNSPDFPDVLLAMASENGRAELLQMVRKVNEGGIGAPLDWRLNEGPDPHAHVHGGHDHPLLRRAEVLDRGALHLPLLEGSLGLQMHALDLRERGVAAVAEPGPGLGAVDAGVEHHPLVEVPVARLPPEREALEGVVAVIVSPELGAAYLGTQGDEWDAQKDTALAFAGSIIAMLLTWMWVRRARAATGAR